MGTILYKNKEYPYKTVTIKVEGEKLTINVSVESLNTEILKNHEEDCYVDTQVGYFVPDDIINLSQRELIKYVEENYI